MNVLNVCGLCLAFLKDGEMKHYSDCPLDGKKKKDVDRMVKNVIKGKNCTNCGSIGGERTVVDSIQTDIVKVVKVKVSTANGAKLKTCSGCKMTFYCGEKCQKEHWKKEHKKMCGKK